MKKLLAIAAFMLASTAAQAQYTFQYGGRTIRIDPDRGTVSIPGVYDNTGHKSKRARTDQDSDKSRKQPAPQDANTQTPAPAPATAEQTPPRPRRPIRHRRSQRPRPPTMRRPIPLWCRRRLLRPCPRFRLPHRFSRMRHPCQNLCRRRPSPPFLLRRRQRPLRLPRWSATQFTARHLADRREGRQGPDRAMRRQSLRLLRGRQIEQERRTGSDQHEAGQGLRSGAGGSSIRIPAATYDSTIAMKGTDTLRVQGCAFGGMFCGGQTWTRVN